MNDNLFVVSALGKGSSTYANAIDNESDVNQRGTDSNSRGTCIQCSHSNIGIVKVA